MNEYVLIEFPFVQKYMEYDWFENEAFLCIDMASAYFIPKERIIK